MIRKMKKMVYNEFNRYLTCKISESKSSESNGITIIYRKLYLKAIRMLRNRTIRSHQRCMGIHFKAPGKKRLIRVDRMSQRRLAIKYLLSSLIYSLPYSKFTFITPKTQACLFGILTFFWKMFLCS